VSVSLQGTIENIYSSQPIISDAGNPVDMVSDSYQILIGLLLCCCFPDVFRGKTASQQQPSSNLVRTLNAKRGTLNDFCLSLFNQPVGLPLVLMPELICY